MNTSRLTLLASTCLAGLLLSSAVQAAEPYRLQSQGSIIGDDVLYSIGGGNAVSMGSVGNMDSIQIGGGWNTNLICGNMSLTNTLQNQPASSSPHSIGILSGATLTWSSSFPLRKTTTMPIPGACSITDWRSSPTH